MTTYTESLPASTGKHGQFEWTGPAILFVCLIFVLLAPNYIWGIVGI